MMSNCIRFACLQSQDKSDLEKIPDFLNEEAKMSLAAGIISTSSSEVTRKIFNQSSRNNMHARKSVLVGNINDDN